MTSPSGVRLQGDDYQHLLAWWHLLAMLLPGSHVRQVTVEHPAAGFADDITVEHEEDSPEPDLFLQVKFHVDYRGRYSTAALLAAEPGRLSLLQKLFASWRRLHRERGRPFEVRLVSNWAWDAADPLGRYIRGEDTALTPGFFAASPKSRIGQARDRWREHLAAEESDFSAFARSLRFRLGHDCTEELESRVAERMMHLGLRSDRTALLAATGIVRKLVEEGRRALTGKDVEALLARHDLHLPPAAEPSVTIYLSTVKKQRFEIPPDFLLDWRGHFEGREDSKGHAVIDPTAWNETMLPELRALERRLREEGSTTRLVRARGLARLSAWMAFGFVFSDVARYVLEVDQQGELWRTDAAPSGLAVVETRRCQVTRGDAGAVAVGISVTGSLEEAVRAHVRESRAASAVLFLRPDRELGRGCFTSAGDVVAFARTAKARMQAFARARGARRVVLYYFGPLSGACFLGHQMNAVAREIQVMEDQQPGYAPSFLLT